MAKPTNAAYDKVDTALGLQPKQMICAQEVVATMVGTYASNTDIVDLFIVPSNMNIKVSAVSGKRLVGGTAAATATNWGIGHSLAGTGTSTVFGTLLFGTVADATYANFTVTATDIPAGNVVRVVGLAGTTSEESQTMSYITVQYQEDWS